MSSLSPRAGPLSRHAPARSLFTPWRSRVSATPPRWRFFPGLQERSERATDAASLRPREPSVSVCSVAALDGGARASRHREKGERQTPALAGDGDAGEGSRRRNGEGPEAPRDEEAGERRRKSNAGGPRGSRLLPPRRSPQSMQNGPLHKSPFHRQRRLSLPGPETCVDMSAVSLLSRFCLSSKVPCLAAPLSPCLHFPLSLQRSAMLASLEGCSLSSVACLRGVEPSRGDGAACSSRGFPSRSPAPRCASSGASFSSCLAFAPLSLPRPPDPFVFSSSTASLRAPRSARSFLSLSLAKLFAPRRKASPVLYPAGLLPSPQPAPVASDVFSPSSSAVAASRPSLQKRMKGVHKLDRRVQSRVVQLGLGAPRNTGEKRQQILHGDRSMSARCPVFLGQLKPRLGKWRAALREEELPPPILPEVAFAGRSNVGKSSLLNELAGRRLTSLVTSRPGTTQHLHFFKAGSPPVLCLVDLPGYGFAKAAAATRLQWTEFSLYYLKTRKNLRRVFVLIDARHGLKESDKEMLHFLHRWGVSWQLVLTKADLVKPKDLVKTLMLVKEDAKAFRHQAADPVAVSALRHQALDVLRREMDGLKIDKEIVKHRIRLRIHSKLEERRLRRQLKAAAKKKTKSEEGREGDGRAHSLSRPSSWVTAACKEGVDLDSRGNAVDGEGAETGLDTPPILERVRRRWNFEDDFSSQETATGDVGSDLPRNTAGLEYEGGDTEQISLDTFIECTEMGQGSWHHRHSLEATAELLSASEFPHAAPSPLLNSDPRQEEQPIHRDRDLCGSEALQPLGRKRGRRRASGSNPSSGELLDVPAAGTEARLQSPDPCPAFFAAADAAAQLALGLNSSVAKEENGRRRERASTASFESGGEEDPRARVPRMDASSPFPKPSLASSSLAAPSPAFDVGEDATCRARGEEGDVLRPASRPSLAVDFDLSLRPGGSSESAGHAGAVTEGVKSEASEVRMGRGCFKDEVDALHLNRKMSTTESGAESEPGEVSFLSSALDSPALFDSLDDDEDPSFLLQRSLQGSSPSSSASPSGGPLSGSVSGRLRRAVQETQEICRSSWQAERVGVTSVAFELTEKAPDVEEEEDEGEDGFSSPFPSLAEARQAARTRKSRLRPAPSPRLSGVAMGQKGDVLLLEDAGHHTGGGGGQAGRRARRQRRSLSGDEAGRFGPDPDPLQQAPEPGVYTGDFERDMRQSWDRRKRMELEDLGNAPSRPLSLGSRSRDKIQSRDERPTPFWRRRKEADAMALSAEAGFIGLDPKALQRPVRGVQKRKLLRRLSRMRLHHLRLQPESVSKRLVAAVGKEAKAGFAAPGIIAAKDRKGGKNYTWEEAMRKWKRWARKHKADAAVYGRPNKRRLLEEQMQMVERKLFRQRLAMKKKEQNEAPGAGLVREFKQRKRQARELARGLEASQNGSFGGSGVMKNKKQSPRSRRLQRKKDEKLAELEAFREWKIQQENKRRGR